LKNFLGLKTRLLDRDKIPLEKLFLKFFSQISGFKGGFSTGTKSPRNLRKNFKNLIFMPKKVSKFFGSI
jgi:hypothetical protein